MLCAFTLKWCIKCTIPSTTTFLCHTNKRAYKSLSERASNNNNQNVHGNIFAVVGTMCTVYFMNVCKVFCKLCDGINECINLHFNPMHSHYFAWAYFSGFAIFPPLLLVRVLSPSLSFSSSLLFYFGSFYFTPFFVSVSISYFVYMQVCLNRF